MNNINKYIYFISFFVYKFKLDILYQEHFFDKYIYIMNHSQTMRYFKYYKPTELNLSNFNNFKRTLAIYKKHCV